MTVCHTRRMPGFTTCPSGCPVALCALGSQHLATVQPAPIPGGGGGGGKLVRSLNIVRVPACHQMGLGKTLQSLMLILANPAPADWVSQPEEYEASGDSLCPIKTTLVVVPANLLDQWQQQVEEHTVEGALKVGV
jgi:hypothetical protein